MMRLGRRALLLVAFYLLTSVATAYAECAWVLWKRETRLSPSMDEKPWEIVRAVPKHDACEVAQAEIIKNIAASYSKGAASTSVVGTAVIISFQDAGGNIVMVETQQYQCLPDTVDPRGSKEK